ncbi:hypothetical protein [Alkaliphilus sp. B6464]|uniref:hypothetical protein n=1 Tax=Alkaliphilus sp. B6464 TaxID=2731219 RepID=UPI001BA59F0D|nr:hypothetical protein [Alkaliphilus sp. B6464]QUH21254.1 hypothetical protein HYG84_16105 [Alkaliphilus sp. B6464]
MSKKNWGGSRDGAGRTALSPVEKKKGAKIYISDNVKFDILKYGKGNSFSEKTVELAVSEICSRKNNSKFKDK